MGVLNDIGQKGAELSRRAKDASDIASMSASVGKMNKQLQEMYTMLGQKYYEEHMDDHTVGMEYIDIFTQISRMQKEIDRANQYITDMKMKNAIYGGGVGTKICKNCGKVLEREARFCTICGQDVTAQDATDNFSSVTVTKNENPDSSAMVTKREQNVNFLGNKLDALEKELERDNQKNE